MRREIQALALVWLLLGGPGWAVELVKIATIPKGQIDFYHLPVGDLNHNGWKELVFAQSLPPFSTNIWEHWGHNSYQPVWLLQEGCAPAVEGDPDQDGLSDLLCQWAGRAFLLESRTPTSFPSRTVWEESIGGFPGLRGYFVDTDRDGQQEMWIVPNDPDVIEVWETQGDNRYARVALLTHATMSPETLAFGDFDGDGKTEIVVGTPLGNLFIWETTGDNTWALVWSYHFPPNWVGDIVVAARDLDGDGQPEFLVGGIILGTTEYFVMIFEATGDNTYAPVWQVQGSGRRFQTLLAVGDVDGDGREEFAVAIRGAVQLYKAFGDNDFRRIGEVPYTDDHAIALADLNGNGVDELIINGPVVDESGVPLQIDIYELADLQPPVLIPAWFPETYQLPPGHLLPVTLELLNRTETGQEVEAWVEVYRGKGLGGPRGAPVARQAVGLQQPLAPHTRGAPARAIVPAAGTRRRAGQREELRTAFVPSGDGICLQRCVRSSIPANAMACQPIKPSRRPFRLSALYSTRVEQLPKCSCWGGGKNLLKMLVVLPHESEGTRGVRPVLSRAL